MLFLPSQFFLILRTEQAGFLAGRLRPWACRVRPASRERSIIPPGPTRQSVDRLGEAMRTSLSRKAGAFTPFTATLGLRSTSVIRRVCESLAISKDSLALDSEETT